MFFWDSLGDCCNALQVGLAYFPKVGGCQRRRWPPAAGRWFSKWMGVACRLSPFTKMDGTACWGIGDSEGKRGAIVLFNCDTFLKILQRSWTIQEDPGKFMNQILQSTKIPKKKNESMMRVWFTPVPLMLLFPLSMPLQVLLGHALQAWTGHADLLHGHVQDSTLRYSNIAIEIPRCR